MPLTPKHGLWTIGRLPVDQYGPPDFWVVRRGTDAAVGRPTLEQPAAADGALEVRTRSPMLLGAYLYYVAVAAHAAGAYRAVAKGTLRLKHITERDVDQALVEVMGGRRRNPDPRVGFYDDPNDPPDIWIVAAGLPHELGMPLLNFMVEDLPADQAKIVRRYSFGLWADSEDPDAVIELFQLARMVWKHKLYMKRGTPIEGSPGRFRLALSDVQLEFRRFLEQSRELFRRRNPAWLHDTTPPRAVQLVLAKGRGGQTEADREEALQDALGVARFLQEVDWEPERQARKRRRRERRAVTAPAPRKPVSLLTAIKRKGGIAYSSWGDPRTRTYPGETGADWRRSLPGVFRAKGRGGMQWDALARDLAADGYGPPADEGLQDTGAIETWLVDTIDAGDARSEFPLRGAGAEKYVMRKFAGDRMQFERDRREWEKQQRKARVANPKKDPRDFDFRMTIAQAYSDLADDRSHGNEYAQDAADQVLEAMFGPKLANEIRSGDLEDRHGVNPRAVREFMRRTISLADDLQNREDNPAPRRRRRRRRRNPSLMTLTNPAPRDAAAADAAYRKFHGVAPRRRRKLGGKGPTLIALGDLIEIVYQPRRGARKGPAYVHKFARGAVVAATVDGRELVLLPSPKRPYRVDWERGIVG